METDFSVEQHTRAVARWSKSELLQLLQFVRLPTLSAHSIDEPDWVLRAFYLAIITVIFVSPFAYLINSLQEYLEIAETRPARIADSATLITVILLTPLVEEAIFRAGLRNPLCSIILAPLVTLGFLIESAVGLFAFLFFFSLSLVIVMLHRNLFFGSDYPKLCSLHRERFKVVFWANAFFFACAHLRNFEFLGIEAALFWLAVLPQFIFAVIFSYLRLRNGIMSAVLCHATVNLIGISAYLYGGR